MTVERHAIPPGMRLHPLRAQDPEFRVSRSMVNDIKRRKRWAHVD
jgi:hypothetical protein